MAGFDTEFNDLDQYIRVITDRIWEQGRIDDIRTYYSDPCVVETPSSVSTALQAIVDGTRATLAMFPDRRLLAEDVIQSGDAQRGFLSSHRIISTMTHRGAGSFGAPTQRRIHVRTIADCVCKDNRIVHEWLVRDQAAIALQTGTTPQALAALWLAAKPKPLFDKPLAGAAPAGYLSHISGHAVAQSYAQTMASFASDPAQAASIARSAYDDAVHHIGPGEAVQYGQLEVGAFWQSLFSALTVSRFSVEHLAFMAADSERPARAALRWRAQAQHLGAGRYGAPSGKPVEIMGICHAEFFRGRVLREWVLIDDVALWMQVLAA